MRSILAFVHKKFKLAKLTRLTELSEKTFRDLSESRQRKFRNKSIRGIVLDEHTDAKARQDLFDRINTSSKSAEPVEIRRGTLPGDFMQLIIRLSTMDYFVTLTPTTEKKKNRREREELVTRFFAYGDGLESYNELPAVFLFDYVDKMNKMFAKNKSLAKEYENRFKQTMDCVKQLFPLGFRKTENATTITRVRFESVAIGTWWAIRDLKDASKICKKNIQKWINCVEYQKMLRADGGNVKKKLQARIEYVHKNLIGEE